MKRSAIFLACVVFLTGCTANQSETSSSNSYQIPADEVQVTHTDADACGAYFDAYQIAVNLPLGSEGDAIFRQGKQLAFEYAQDPGLKLDFQILLEGSSDFDVILHINEFCSQFGY